MKYVDKLMRMFGYSKGGMKVVRTYEAAQTSNMLADFPTAQYPINSDIRSQNADLRARARHLVQNDPYARKYLRLRRINVVGTGFFLAVKTGKYIRSDGGDAQFVLNANQNKIIQDAFYDWAKRENCTVSGDMSFVDVCNLVCDHSGRDGEFLIRKVRNPNAKYGFQLEILEPDLLPETLNDTLSNGNKITLGVELNNYRKPVAYHLLVVDPRNTYETGRGKNTVRVPASDIYHGFDRDRAFQTRGVTIFADSMVRLKMLGAYETAALVNARASACKLGHYVSESGEQVPGDSEDSSGNKISQMEPGVITQLPPGVKFEGFDPKYPDSQHDIFTKVILRGVASGLGVAYMSFASDPGDANYSSARVELLTERDSWKSIQNWMIESFLEPLFKDWLEMAIISGALPLRMSNFDDLNKPVWIGRRWGWVDPKGDVEAEILAINNRLKTRSEAIAERGGDIEEIYSELGDEEELAQKYGLPPIPQDGGNAPAQMPINDGKVTEDGQG